ncbi:MAG: hypothetical protein RL033_590, partial [Pseudomonadota bacterium]
LEATTALFEASETVTRAEFGRFVRPALERYPGIRALEYVPVVKAIERERYELAARADGLTGFSFRQQSAAGQMVPRTEAPEYLPIYFMEPGHPLVLGFDCLSEPVRRWAAERARTRLTAVSSERLSLLEDPPSVYSIAVFQPVFATEAPRSADNVRGLTVEVFRVSSLAERALDESRRRGIEITLLDLDAQEDKRLLFESSGARASAPAAPFLVETTLRFADRTWKVLLTPSVGAYAADTGGTWLLSLGGIGMSGLLAFGVSAVRIIRRLRRQVREAEQFGQYTLLERLGEGGMGVVYKARHALLRRPTAIKLLAGHDHDTVQLARFEREVQLTSELTHPNTIAIYDYGRTPAGVFYYAMEYIDGLTFEQLVANGGPLPAARVSHLMLQAASAIAEAHDVGLIHRDIKPANLMLCKRGGIADFVKVMDFGLAKHIGVAAPGTRHDITQSASGLLGTPSYMAPESIIDPLQIDARVDVYALGAVAYYLLVGLPVFEGETIVELCVQHLHTPPVAPSRRTRNAVPPAMEQLILRCLEKDRNARFSSMHALVAALRKMPDLGSWTSDDANTWWQSHGAALARSLQEKTKLERANTAQAGSGIRGGAALRH